MSPVSFEHTFLHTYLNQVEITVHPMIIFNLFDPVRVAYETFDLVREITAFVHKQLQHQILLQVLIGNDHITSLMLS